MIPYSPLTSPRKGMALVATLVVVVVVSLVLGSLATQFLHLRQRANRQLHDQQAEYLARAGVELAIDGLLHKPDYKGETVSPLRNASVKITVEPIKGQANTYRIRSEARYPTDLPRSSLRMAERTLRRISDKTGTRMEAAPADKAGK